MNLRNTNLLNIEGFLVVSGLYEFLQPRLGSPKVAAAARTRFLLQVSPGGKNFSLLTIGKV